MAESVLDLGYVYPNHLISPFLVTFSSVYIVPLIIAIIAFSGRPVNYSRSFLCACAVSETLSQRSIVFHTLQFFPKPTDERKITGKWREALVEPKPNPVNRTGDRNLYCPYYEGCLDHAVESRWQYWNCSECSHKQRQQSISGVQTAHDPPSYKLPTSIHRDLRHRFT